MDAKLIDKIRKLMALTESSNEHEAANAAAKAAALLQEHNLSLGDINLSEAQADPMVTVPGETLGGRWSGKGRYAGRKTVVDITKTPWIVSLLNATAKAHFCWPLVRRNQIYFAGRKTDVEVAQFVFQTLYYHLVFLCAERAKAYSKDYKVQYGESARFAHGTDNINVWRKSWLLGASTAIVERLNTTADDFNQAISANGSTTGLMVMETRLTDAERELWRHLGWGDPVEQRRKWAEKRERLRQEALERAARGEAEESVLYGKPRKARARREKEYVAPLYNYGAYEAGIDDGRRANIPVTGKKVSGQLPGGEE